MKGLIGSIVSRLARLVPCTPTLYYAKFYGGPMVQVNAIAAGPLIVGTSGAPGEDAYPSAGTLQQPATVGLWLEISKRFDIPVVIMCALSPFPPGLPRKFTMVVHGELAGLDPQKRGDLWGVAVLARDSDKLGDPNIRSVGASHQVRNLGGLVPRDHSTGVQIALGAGNGTDQDSVMPPVVDGLTDPSIAYLDLRDLSFTLETDIDLDLGLGRSRLRTTGKPWDERGWTFHFDQVTGVGFGLAMPSVPGLAAEYGRGTALACIYDFRIYRYRPWWRWWWYLCRYLNWSISDRVDR